MDKNVISSWAWSVSLFMLHDDDDDDDEDAVDEHVEDNDDWDVDKEEEDKFRWEVALSNEFSSRKFSKLNSLLSLWNIFFTLLQTYIYIYINIRATF